MSSLRDVESGLSQEEERLLDPLEKFCLTPPSTRPLCSGSPLPCRSPPAATSSTRERTVAGRALTVDIPDRIPDTAASSVASSPCQTTAASQQPRRKFRGDRRIRRLNTEVLEAIECKDFDELESLLEQGGNPNATCRLAHVSACHVAAMVGGEALALLMKHGADKHRQDQLGRTPLHIAAWFGHARQMAILLDLPEELYERLDSEDMSSGTEDDLRKMCQQTKRLANTRCSEGELKMLLPQDWKDNIDHNCRDIKGTFPLIQPGWTPLHVASARGRSHCTRLLLAAGANPNCTDARGCTPLDVAGVAHHEGEHMAVDSVQFASVVSQLLAAGGVHNTMRLQGVNHVNSPLHTAVELECLHTIQSLLQRGASISCHNARGETPLHVCVRKELEDPLQLLASEGVNDLDPLAAAVDVKDAEGHTVLQTAVEAGWVSGVCVALEADADLALKANDGETALHSAAGMDNLDVLNEILGSISKADLIDCQNSSGETPLFKAIIKGNLECVRAILNKGAATNIKLPGDVSIVHKATELGHAHILEELIKLEKIDKSMINEICKSGERGIGPIHYAVLSNNLECVKLLLNNGADIRLRTTSSPHRESTPLHIAATKNLVEVASTLLEYDKYTIHEVNSQGWYPLHLAAHHGSREVVPLLLQAGADLAGYTDGPKRFRRTAIDMIVNNISKPTDFLENLFDSYISTNSQNLQDIDCEIVIDYSILMPRSCEMEQMKVIEAILKTGNRYGQKRVLIHPLIESFLYLKWKALLPFFYTILAVYGMFVMSLTVFSVSVFHYKDTQDVAPVWLYPQTWGYILYATVILIVLQELLYMNVKSSRYFLQLETWVKFGSLGLAVILPAAVSVAAWSSSDWPRHVATLALLLAWMEMMFLLSRFPNWGYYVLMFGKVATNVIKILLTFAFLVIGFSLSFMIQFRSDIPFEGPWAAFVKTMVMMTSEFDYGALFDEEHTRQLSTSIIVVRLIFVIFLVLAAIVLMNLMVGVAVNDINDLEILGNIQRLAKQVQFLGTLDILVYNKFFSKILPKNINDRVKRKRNVSNILRVFPGKPRWRHRKILPARLREVIFNKATSLKKLTDDDLAIQVFKQKLDEIHDKVIINPGSNAEDDKKDAELLENAIRKRRHEDIVKQLDAIDDRVDAINDHINTIVDKTKEPIETITVKVDQMAMEIEIIKQFLSRLESKLGNIK